MESQTLEGKELADRPASFSDDILEEIIVRSSVKFITRFRAASKSWNSRISDPSFAEYHLARASAKHLTGLCISAYEESTKKRYLLSAANDGGGVAHLMTLDASHTAPNSIRTEHSNGLACFSFVDCFPNYSCARAFILNPSTRKIFNVPDDSSGSLVNRNPFISCMFGFDEKQKEHKILIIKERRPSNIRIMIYTASSSSWKEVDARLPVDFSTLRPWFRSSVCVNSVIHMTPLNASGILGFDLTTEKFLVTTIPGGVVPRQVSQFYVSNGNTIVKSNDPRITKINGCLAVVCHDTVVENNEMDIWIWIHRNCAWVKKFITFPAPWTELGEPYPSDSINVDEIIFTSSKPSWKNMIHVLVYNMSTERFKSLDFALDHPLLCSKTLKFDHIRCYLESLLLLDRSNA